MVLLWYDNSTTIIDILSFGMMMMILEVLTTYPVSVPNLSPNVDGCTFILSRCNYWWIYIYIFCTIHLWYYSCRLVIVYIVWYVRWNDVYTYDSLYIFYSSFCYCCCWLLCMIVLARITVNNGERMDYYYYYYYDDDDVAVFIVCRVQ